MARKPATENPNNYFHVTSRSINSEWFLNLEDTWNVFQNSLWMTKHFFNLEIYAFVMMSNHFHLIVRAPNSNLSSSMGYFLRESSRQIQKSSCRKNQIFAERFRRCEINSYHYFLNAYKYVYQNPLRAKLIGKAEDYPFSTLGGLLGKCHLMIPLEEDTLIFDDTATSLKWLNTLPAEAHSESVRKALRRRVFQLPNVNGRQNPLEIDML